LRRVRRTLNPRSRYTRHTRLWLTRSPFLPLPIASQQHPQPPITVARLFARQGQQPLTQRGVVAPALIPVTHARNLHQPADAALARGVLLDQAPHFRSSFYEPSEFFRITDCSMSLSRLRSATSFFSREFSSRSCLTSCASLTSMPPYFDFQA